MINKLSVPPLFPPSNMTDRLGVQCNKKLSLEKTQKLQMHPQEANLHWLTTSQRKSREKFKKNEYQIIVMMITTTKIINHILKHVIYHLTRQARDEAAKAVRLEGVC